MRLILGKSLHCTFSLLEFYPSLLIFVYAVVDTEGISMRGQKFKGLSCHITQRGK